MSKIFFENDRVICTDLVRSPQGLSTLNLDSHTNGALLSAINADPSAYSIVDGVLTRDGSPVAIADWCDDCKTLDSLDTASTVAQLKKVLMLMRDKPGFTKG